MSKLEDNNTTDAIPNPRDTDDGLDDKKQTLNNEEIPQSEEKINKNTSTKKKSTTKKYISPPVASATVINVIKSKDVHIGNNITYNLKGNERNVKPDIPETPAIKLLKENKNPVTKDDLWFVAIHMDSDWKAIARELSIGEGQISQFIADNQMYGTKEVIFQMLLDWYRNDPMEATIGKLGTVLWDNGQKEVIKKWAHQQK